MLLSQQQSYFDKISLYRSIFTKYRETKMLQTHFGETFGDILGLFWLKGVCGGSETPSTKEKQDFSPHF